MSYLEKDNNLLVFFGLPGSGKSYLAKFASDHYQYRYYEADDDLPPYYVEWLRAGKIPTDEMRADYYRIMLGSLRSLCAEHGKVAMACMCPKEKLRYMILDQFPQALFVWVRVPEDIRQQRVASRQNHFVSSAVANGVIKTFEKPTIPHQVLINTGNEKYLRSKLQKIMIGEKDEYCYTGL